jgi:hypothetical protein
MQESRGDPDARGADGEIGIMQVLPSSVPATAGQLEQSSKNLYHGIGLLESYTWEAQAVVDGTTAEYRKELYSSVPAASELAWWYGPDGQTALAMYQCGPGNIREGGSCGRFGGYVYASTVMGCWAPWVRQMLYGDPTPTPSPIPTAAPTVTHRPPPNPTVLPSATIGATLAASPAGREERRIELIYCFPLGASVLAVLILTLRDLRRKHASEKHLQ